MNGRSFMDVRTLHISTLSPVHVGANEDYDPTNYVIDSETLYEFDSGSFAAALPPKEQERLLNIVSGEASDNTLKQIQSLFYNNRNRLITRSEHRIPVGVEVSKLYQSRIGKTAQREEGGRGILNKLEIERTFYNPITRLPVLPGSSIKGAIRTALLDMTNMGNALQDREEKSRALQQRLLGYEMRSLERDPMRLISLSDAMFRAHANLYGSEVKFAVNRKRYPVSDEKGRLVQSQAERQGLYQLLECVPCMRHRQFEGSLRVNDVDDLGRYESKIPSFKWGAEGIAAACNRFYQPLLEQELKMLAERGYVDNTWVRDLHVIMDGRLFKRLEDNTAFLLRIGRHSGAESVTLNGLRSIRIMMGKDEKTGRPRYEFQKEPKTIWLAANDRNAHGGMLPFGWLLVEIEDPEKPKLPYPDLMEVMRRHNGPAYKWMKEEEVRQIKIREQVVEQITRERKKLEEEREAQMRAKEEAKREQERIAAMSPLEKELHVLAEKNKGQKNYVTWLLALEAGKWDGEQAKEVAERIRDVMRKEKQWREKSAKKRPEKDKPYQFTIRVKRLLGED